MLGAAFGTGRLFVCSLPAGVLGKLGDLALTGCVAFRVGEARSGTQTMEEAELLYLSYVQFMI